MARAHASGRIVKLTLNSSGRRAERRLVRAQRCHRLLEPLSTSPGCSLPGSGENLGSLRPLFFQAARGFLPARLADILSSAQFTKRRTRTLCTKPSSRKMVSVLEPP